MGHCSWRDERAREPLVDRASSSNSAIFMGVENPIDWNETGETSERPESVPDAEFCVTEDIALAQLKNRDLSSGEIAELCKNRGLLKSRNVRFALAAHPHTARQLALRLIRELYTFDLMQLSLTPSVAADLKRLADELLVSRLPSITLGERLSLARRSSTLVAAALLLDKESRVWQAALQNSRLTEAAIIKAVQAPGSSAFFVETVCHHEKWSVRHEVRVALLRNRHTPLARAIEFARRLPPPLLRDVLHTSRLPEKIKAYLRTTILGRTNAARATGD